MKKERRKKLEAAGFKVGTVQEFLDLTDEEMEIIEMRVALAKSLKNLRRKLKVSQTAFASKIGSSQSRVAKMEAGDPSVSLDLLVRSLIKAGASRKEIGRAITRVA